MSNKKKGHRKPPKIKINLNALAPKPKPISFVRVSDHLLQARSYPLHSCWVMEEWQDSGLTPVLVARQMPTGRILYASILVDLMCLGVKSAYWEDDLSPNTFERFVHHQMMDEPQECSASLAHEIIYGAIEFAARYGFEPHFDFKETSLILDPPETHARDNGVVFGKDGQPFYVMGPDDHPQMIMNQLRATAGDGNFHYLIGAPPGFDPDEPDDDQPG